MICRKYKDIQYSGGSFRQKLRRSIHSFIRGRVKFQFIASALHQKVKLIAGDSPNISGRIGSTEENQGFPGKQKHVRHKQVEVPWEGVHVCRKWEPFLSQMLAAVVIPIASMVLVYLPTFG